MLFILALGRQKQKRISVSSRPARVQRAPRTANAVTQRNSMGGTDGPKTETKTTNQKNHIQKKEKNQKKEWSPALQGHQCPLHLSYSLSDIFNIKIYKYIILAMCKCT